MTDFNLPEGTKYAIKLFNPYDLYDRDFAFDYYNFVLNNRFNGGDYTSNFIIPQYDFSNATTIRNINYGAATSYSEYVYLPTFNVSKISSWESFLTRNVYDLVLLGEPNSALSTPITNQSAVNAWYDVATNPNKIGVKTCCAPTYVIPYGSVPVKIRVMKDGEWMNGQPLNYNHQPMTYSGKGLYECVIEQEPRTRFNYVVDDGENFQSLNITNDLTILYFGDNNNLLTTFTGDEINNLVTSNDGWAYNSEVDGFANNKIADKGTTSMTIQVPSSNITLVYGQSSEKKYDYADIYDGNNSVILSLKDIEGDNLSNELYSEDGVFKFTYHKDTSGSKGSDLFWIKSIQYATLPPYPEN